MHIVKNTLPSDKVSWWSPGYRPTSYWR